MRRKWRTCFKRAPKRSRTTGRHAKLPSLRLDDTIYHQGGGGRGRRRRRWKSQWSSNDSLGIPLVKCLLRRNQLQRFPEKFLLACNDRSETPRRSATRNLSTYCVYPSPEYFGVRIRRSNDILRNERKFHLDGYVLADNPILAITLANVTMHKYNLSISYRGSSN